MRHRSSWGDDKMPKSSLMDKFMSKVSIPANRDECWIWTGHKDRRGYGTLSSGSNVHWRASRLSYTLFCGPIHDGHFVCHSCDNPPCVNPAHLWTGTHSDNMRDMAKKSRGKNFRAKLTKDDAKTIKEITSNSIKFKDIEDKFGITRTEVRSIRRGNGKIRGSKLSDEDLKEIELLLSIRVKQTDLAEKFNVKPRQIRRINSGKDWAHV